MNEASGGLSGASNFFKLFQARVSKNSPQIGDAASKAATSTGSSSSATPSTTPLAGTNTQMPTCTDIMTTQSDISIVSGDLLVAQMLSPLADRIGKIEVDMAANPPESFPSLSSRDLELNFNYSSGKLIGVVELTTSSADRDASTSMQRELGATKDFVRGSSSNAPFLPGGVQKASYAPSARSLLKRAQKDLSALSSIAKNPLFDFSEKKTFILPSLNMGVKFHEETDACQLIQGDQSLLSPIATQDDDENDFWGSQIKKPSPVADDGAKDAFYYRDLKRDREDDRLRRESHITGLREVVRETSSVLSQSSSSIGEAALSVSSEVSSELSSSDSLLSASDMLRLNGSSSTSTSAWLQASRSTPSSTLTSEWAITQRMANIGADFNVLVPDPAIIYPFEMDDFQKEAAYHLEQGESVFIAAHTSAGKTVVAEYAIALAMKHSTRAIYTSPIKALSNQKYRDFKDTFGDDVGLITGDVSVHPEASCLIVTTEILRSMLYKGADLVRDVEWVIFDEVHYINDLERGVVWEEVIIMLPAHVGLIFLSATVPNTFEFADWVGRTKRKKVFVISTNKRPVPLEHYLYHDKNIYKISDSKDGFLIGGFSTVTNLIRTRQEKRDEGRAKKAGAAAPPPRRFTRSSNGVSPGTWSNIVTMLRAKDLLPAVCFVFSKKKCLELAKSLLHIDLTNRDEKNEVRRFIAESMKRLKGTDKDLPQVQVMSELLSRGIGVHHGGLLPIVKEIVEILFSVSLIKVLFATETFAMGVNMPTRTVVFDSLSKYDGGKGRRPLLPGEYIQMSGRAGRRGLDTVGTVIVATQEELPDSASLRTVLTGRATRLSSQFRLTYNMILNLLKMGGDFRIEDMIKRSFFESSNQKDNTKLKDKLQLSKSLLAQTERVKCEKDIEDVPMTTYYSLVAQEMTLQRRIQQWLAKSSYCSEYLCPGRVLIVNIQGFPKQSYAVVVRAPGTISGNKNTQEASNEAKLTTMRILVLTGSAGRALTDKYKVLVVDAASSEIELVTMKRVKNLEPERIDIVPDEYHLNQVLKDLDDFRIEALPGFPPVLDPIKGLKIKDMDFIDMNAKLREVREIYATSPCHKCEFKEKHFALEERYVKLKTQVEAIEYLLSDDNLLMIPEYEARLGVLKRLDYVNIDGVVQLKGRVARELNNCDELIATELIFMNSFSSMPPDEICALLSCFVCEGRSDGDPVVPPALKASQQLLIQLATRLGELQVDMGVPITPQEFVDENVQVGLMEVVYEWAHNRPFQEIMRLTDYQEGSIVRTIVRLDETLRDFRSAAILMGNVDLAHKMEEASHLIKRDIVFASSLYIAEDQQKQQKQKLGYDGSALADEQEFDVDPENIEGDIEDEAGIVDFEDGGIVEF